jgi:hypothetical protein
MREPLEIINELKHVTYWSQPNMKYEETMNLLFELEATLSLAEEIVVIEEQTVEEPIVEVVEEVVIEETVTEEPTIEVAAPKKTTRKK